MEALDFTAGDSLSPRVKSRNLPEIQARRHTDFLTSKYAGTMCNDVIDVLYISHHTGAYRCIFAHPFVLDLLICRGYSSQDAQAMIRARPVQNQIITCIQLEA